MLKIKLLAHTNLDPLDLASHAARICYSPQTPTLGERIDVEKRLFLPGHHTTLQHFFCTFQIENISVGDVKFGLHLTHPFYNSDERSGRFASKMYSNPNLSSLEKSLLTSYPTLKKDLPIIRKYLKKCFEIYQNNLPKATTLATEFIKTERPNTSAKYLEQNAPKFAQEQLRMFMPLLFPTTLDHTLNLSALIAFYHSAWSPSLKSVADKMSSALLKKFPTLKFMFNPSLRRPDSWGVPTPPPSKTSLKQKPTLSLLTYPQLKKINPPSPSLQHPTDLLHFTPELMNLNTQIIQTKVSVSSATFGQDQRHRTIRRSTPRFTGGFYLPPLLQALNLSTQARQITKSWLTLSQKLPPTISHLLAPHGAMVSYTKSAPLNALIHEQSKRLCWCAQEEIYHLSRSLHSALKRQKSPLHKLLAPPCASTGHCTEGIRYCGRKLPPTTPHPLRKV